MAKRSRTHKALAVLLPVGVLGASVVLAAAQAKSLTDTGAVSDSPDASSKGVAERLQAIRSVASDREGQAATLDVGGDPKMLLAQWLNIGPGGGGLAWRNGGWRNAGWGPAPWRNAGWPNWHNGWRNWGNGPWRNFWRNW